MLSPVETNQQKTSVRGAREVTTVLSLINMKGGVGKTTLAMQLAHTAASKKLRTLAVDLDPQSNLSQVLMGSREYVTVETLKVQFPNLIFSDIFSDRCWSLRAPPSALIARHGTGRDPVGKKLPSAAQGASPAN